MKIIIVGGGISGLSTFLFFKKYLSELPFTPSVYIYERHINQANISSTKTGENDSSEEGATFEELSSSTAIVGGGLGVSPNGMRLLKELGQELHDTVVKEGFPCDNFVFRSSRGWRLSSSPSGDRRVDDGEEVCIGISRHKLWESLDGYVSSGNGDAVAYKKVVEARVGVDGKKPCVVFEDGSVEEADLVIGADGVRSVVKKGIFGVDKEGKEEFAPVYEYVHPFISSLALIEDADNGLVGVYLVWEALFPRTPILQSPKKRQWFSHLERMVSLATVDPRRTIQCGGQLAKQATYRLLRAYPSKTCVRNFKGATGNGKIQSSKQSLRKPMLRVYIPSGQRLSCRTGAKMGVSSSAMQLMLCNPPAVRAVVKLLRMRKHSLCACRGS
jgi:hypothetical protein